MKNKQLKQKLKQQKQAEEAYFQMVRDKLEHKFFNDNVSKWRQWLMIKFPFFRQRWNYEIGLVDGCLDKMILTLNGKMIAKTF